jgi:hypothetical protein
MANGRAATKTKMIMSGSANATATRKNSGAVIARLSESGKAMNTRKR